MTEPDEPADGGVLSSLPSTRPQRRSPKRSARPATAGPTATPRRRATPTPAARPRRSPQASPTPTPAAPPRRGGSRPAATATQARAAGPVGAAGPDRRTLPAAQGFNAGRAPVDPPSRTDLLGSVLSGAGEIAEIGLSAGRHVLRSIYGRLPRP